MRRKLYTDAKDSVWKEREKRPAASPEKQDKNWMVRPTGKSIILLDF